MVDALETAPDPLQSLGQRSDLRLPVLTVVHHPHPDFVGRRLVVERKVTLGRGRSELGAGGLDDDLLSRAHAELEPLGEGLVVRDLESRNGTYVDGQAVREAPLVPGSVLGIGAISMVLGRGPRRFTAPDDPLLIGLSPALAQVLDDIRAVAREPLTVLIRGETGVGKELVARRIHELSGRRGELVAVNCGAVGDSVLQSELFGHARGAFSGAERDRPGLVAAAEGGTLFLDEIGDASPQLQTALLRLLQDRVYRPVGSDRSRESDARFIAATHQRLDPAVAEGRFRQDLLARLRRFVIAVPPLRERREDILPIARSYLAERLGPAVSLDRRLAVALLLHPWPDNVRGLVAVLDNAAMDAEGGRVGLTPRVVERLDDLARLAEVVPSSEATTAEAPADPERERFRKQRPDGPYLEQRLQALGGNVKELAAELGVSRNTLYRWFREAGLDPKSFR
ncbi:MAG: sigma 54-interacting transcriptional regulator [Polyangiaceae bacterium]